MYHLRVFGRIHVRVGLLSLLAIAWFMSGVAVASSPGGPHNHDSHLSRTAFPKLSFHPQQTPDQIVAMILGQCRRDAHCVIQHLKSLAGNAPEEVVVFAANQIPLEWEKAKATCHDLAHHVAGFLFEYLDHNVSKALATVDGRCGNAMYHGIIEQSLFPQIDQQHLTKDGMDVTTICDNVGSSLHSNLRMQCAHGLGHAVAKVYNNDVFQGVKRCDDLHEESDRDMCYDGVLMENNGVNNRTGGGSFSKEDPYFPCSQLGRAYKRRCYFYQGYYLLRLNHQAYKRSMDQCEQMPDPQYVGTCIGAVSQEMTYHHFYRDLSSTVTMCRGVKAQYYMNCILPSLDALTLYLDEGLGREFCGMIQANHQTACRKRWKFVREYIHTK